MKGLFIVFEGIAGAGKKTHISLLKEKLGSIGKETFVLSFPDYENPIGRLTKRTEIDSYTQALLFAADRYFHQKDIAEALKIGKVVLCDRYSYSNYIYQSVLGVDEEWLREIEKNLIKPHIVFLIDVPVEIGIKRIRQSKIGEFVKKEIVDRLERQRDILEKVRRKYLEVSKSEKEVEWHVIDGTRTVEEIQAEIWKIVTKKLSE